MNNYIVNNIEARNHSKIYAAISTTAIFDLDESQHGWEDFSKIDVGDRVYVICASRNIPVAYEVTKVEKGVLLDRHAQLGHIYRSSGSGTAKAIFGKVIERVDLHYREFVKLHGIKDSKINSETGVMLKGFNCAAF